MESGNDIRSGCCQRHSGAPLTQYVRDVLRYSNVPKSIFLVCLIYCFRTNRKELDAVAQGLPSSSLAIHQCPHCMFLGCLVVAAKYCEDNAYTNAHWARWAGLPLPETSQLESEVLQALNFCLYVSDQAFQQWITWYTNDRTLPGCELTVSQKLILVILNLNKLASNAAPLAQRVAEVCGEAPLRASLYNSAVEVVYGSPWPSNQSIATSASSSASPAWMPSGAVSTWVVPGERPCAVVRVSTVPVSRSSGCCADHGPTPDGLVRQARYGRRVHPYRRPHNTLTVAPRATANVRG